MKPTESIKLITPLAPHLYVLVLCMFCSVLSVIKMRSAVTQSKEVEKREEEIDTNFELH